MDDIQLIKEDIKSKIIWSSSNDIKCGLKCGIQSDITLYSELLGFSITVSHNKSQLKNKEFAFTVFEMVLDEVIR